MTNTTATAKIDSDSLTSIPWVTTNNSTAQDNSTYPVAAYAVVVVISMLVIVIGNTLVIAAVCKFRALRTITNVYVVCLAIADLFVGLHMPYQLSMTIIQPLQYSFNHCIARYSTILVPGAASLFLLLGTAVDRLIAIQWPLRYNSLMTRNRVLTIVAIIWTFAVLFGAIPALGVNDWKAGMVCDYLQINNAAYIQLVTVGIMVVLFILIVTYGIIVRTAMKQLRKIYDLHIQNMAGNPTVRTLQKDTKAAKSLALVVGVFVICYLPFTIGTFIESLKKNQPIHFLVHFRYFAYTLVTLNSGMNPIIYGLRMRSFRRAYKRLLGAHNATVDESTVVFVAPQKNLSPETPREQIK